MPSYKVCLQVLQMFFVNQIVILIKKNVKQNKKALSSEMFQIIFALNFYECYTIMASSSLEDYKIAIF